MKHLEEFVKEGETGSYSSPKFVVKPAAGDTGYALLSKEFGSTTGPKKKNKKSRNQEELKEEVYGDITSPAEISGMGGSEYSNVRSVGNTTSGGENNIPTGKFEDPDEAKADELKNIKRFCDFVKEKELED